VSETGRQRVAKRPSMAAFSIIEDGLSWIARVEFVGLKIAGCNLMSRPLTSRHAIHGV
jgi:hypothetical protein